MITYKEPVVELHPSPVALDKAIQAVQGKLAALPWLQKAFGRAILQKAKLPGAKGIQPTTQNYTYPETYYKGQPFSLMMNDNLAAYCFFHVGESMKFLDWEAFTVPQAVEQPISIIFWANLEKIDAARWGGENHVNFMEELREGAVQVLKRCPNIKLQGSEISFDKVFEPYTITETFRQFLKLPFVAFRLDGTISFDYLNNC